MPAAPARTFKPTPAGRRGAATAERILDAAEGLFAERGYSATTLRDVATRVGIQNPSLYNHFESKEALYAAVLERDIGPVLEALSEFLLDGSEGSGDPAQVAERVMELLARRPRLPRLVAHETLSGGDQLTRMLREWMVPVFARAHRMVEISPGAERWNPDQIPHLVLAMYHIVIGYFTIAPLYEALTGDDLLAEQALERQTRLLREIVGALFTSTEKSAG